LKIVLVTLGILISLNSIVPSLIDSFQLIIERIVIGLSQIAPIMSSRPDSILLAIAISPSFYLEVL